MTYKDKIVESMQTITLESIELPDGTVQEAREMLPLPFSNFLLSIGALKYLCAITYMGSPFSRAIFSIGKDEEECSIESLMLDRGLFHRSNAFSHFRGFVGWLLNQEVPDDDDMGAPTWCNAYELAGLYNDYVRDCNKRA